MLRWLAMVSFAVAAGCGSSGDRCADLQAQMSDVVAAHQSCTQDSDCHFAYDLDSCSEFYNGDGLDEMGALMKQFQDAGCQTTCMALKPVCHAGHCNP